ncbi:MAG TPA: hypothetical protein VNZ26_26795 [Vicinamibacterales bacterium]|jgi:hypothetical protein|nr:hypothetical protein [Vicinamibacterales bacterium]
MARLTPLLLLTLLTVVPLAAQATKDGHPDLQGVWNYSSLTPLERPSELGSKEVLTDEEAAAYEKQRLEQTNADRRNPGTAGDLGLAYNDFWYDRGRRIVSTRRTSLVVSPPDGRIPPLTEAAQKRLAAQASFRGRVPEGPEDRSLAERCLVFNAGPPMAPGPYNNNFQLFQSRDRVIIMNEMIHNARVIQLDGRPHLPKSVRQWQGDSRGRWEGNTLVVDTTNFTDQTPFRGSDENLHLIERFTRLDADTLMYEFTIDDPSAFTKPWTVALPMTRMDEPIYEYACHEGNYALGNILKGARAGVK